WLNLTAHGTPGHGSRPTPDNPVHRLVRALSRIAAYQTPLVVTPAVERYFRDLSTIETDQARRAALADVRAALRDSAAVRFLTGDLTYNALLRNTISITGPHGSDKPNVIPPRAPPTLDVRPLPRTPLQRQSRRSVRTVPPPPPSPARAGGAPAAIRAPPQPTARVGGRAVGASAHALGSRPTRHAGHRGPRGGPPPRVRGVPPGAGHGSAPWSRRAHVVARAHGRPGPGARHRSRGAGRRFRQPRPQRHGRPRAGPGALPRARRRGGRAGEPRPLGGPRRRRCRGRAQRRDVAPQPAPAHPSRSGGAGRGRRGRLHSRSRPPRRGVLRRRTGRAARAHLAQSRSHRILAPGLTGGRD